MTDTPVQEDPPITDHAGLYMAVGEIRADVRRLTGRDTKLNDRVTRLETHETWIGGIFAALTFLNGKSILDFVRGMFGA
jgi:hypothetical protein